MKKGDTKGAIQIIEQILSMDPPNAKEYLDLISQLKTNQPG